MISRFSAHLIIHGFALSHGATAFFLDHVPVPGSATAALTAETVAMVAIIVKVCGVVGLKLRLKHLPHNNLPDLWE